MQLAQQQQSSSALFQSFTQCVSARECDEHRQRLEDTVKQGFLAAYNASLTSFMPLLCQYKTQQGH
ncbi:MAG: thermostable hemolysin, partial [Pseudoalteromonas tetraodonis]|nr:thermostable hemolysin [Pseudoalteromonas tetraodonis]